VPINPYANSLSGESVTDEPEYSESQNGYAAPRLADAPYNDEFGWAPSLRLGADSIPDASRLGKQPRRDMASKPEMPSDDPNNFYGLRDVDKARQESVTRTYISPVEQKFRVGDPNPADGANRWARNPREIPSPEPRITQQLIPVMRFFTRPFMTNQPKSGARDLNGVHFSMADHRRDYDIYGMAPAKTRRNTFRIEPTPWDTDIVDMPAPDPTPDLSPVPGIAVDYVSRNWRLGG
jgi:hypothetical protein